MVGNITSTPLVQSTLGYINNVEVPGRDEPGAQSFENVLLDDLFLGYVMEQMGKDVITCEVIGEALKMTSEYNEWERSLWDIVETEQALILAEWECKGGNFAKAAREIREEIRRGERR